jgi:hypothetical protein
LTLLAALHKIQSFPERRKKKKDVTDKVTSKR